jgi:hypothetical protein
MILPQIAAKILVEPYLEIRDTPRDLIISYNETGGRTSLSGRLNVLQTDRF